jgi:hypothetical protein
MTNSFEPRALAVCPLSVSLSMPPISAAPIVSTPGTEIHNGIDEFSSINRVDPGRAGPARVGPARVGGGGRANVNVGRGPNFNANRRANVNVRRGGVAVAGRRPVRRWATRPYYGTVLGGIVLGTIIGVAIAGTAPVAPAPNMCWFWTDPNYTQGYWDYCNAP